MKILYKLTLGFAIISLLVGLQAYTGYTGATTIKEKYTIVTEETLPVIEHLNNIRVSGLKIVESTNEILKTSMENKDYIDTEIAEISEYSITYNESMEIYESKVNAYFPEERDFLDNTKINMQDILRLSSELINLKKNGGNQSQIEETERAFIRSEDEFITNMDLALDKEKDELQERTEITNEVMEKLRYNSIFSGIISIFIALGMGYYLSHRISLPIIELKNASSEISKGNLETQIEINTKDEIEDLGRTFNLMTNNLSNSRNETALAIEKQKILNDNLKKSLNEKDMLLREIHHRVKNNLQIVTSLLNLQSQTIEEEKQRLIFTESQNRIYAMALIHEKLYQSQSVEKIDLKEYITGIVTNISESYGNKSNIKFDINVENISLNIDYAVPTGLIINELITNSYKYAFPDKRQGIITIFVRSDENEMIHISIRDNGIGIEKDLDIRNTSSLGLKLIVSLAESQIHGELILNRENGTEFQINFRQDQKL
ncbi:MAG: HAMP domain-containing protein [Candidatus Methanoperedens sp.]|nr:HAMP domain-containing protein [Candidatus Methanoperedens sp.]